jgi:hypothetical protein
VVRQANLTDDTIACILSLLTANCKLLTVLAAILIFPIFLVNNSLKFSLFADKIG